MNIYDFKVKDTSGNEVGLDMYKGKVLLVVNTATQCGLTPQYEGLEKLYKGYRDKGLEILDFPCNQFKEQAPESIDEINSFCSLNYGTTFPRFGKVNVNGDKVEPLYIWLKESKPHDKGNDNSKEFEDRVRGLRDTDEPGDIKWNFGKFLIDREGNVVERFSPALTPEEIIKDIEKYI